MNVFILNTGRCGSTTFIKACKHIRNYSAAHESRVHLLGPARLQYPPNHIEADNRLSWFLGRLEQVYGDNAFYVHLQRNPLDTAHSFAKRYDFGIITAYRSAVLIDCPPESDPIKVCLDYCETVNTNIEAFLADKSHTMTFHLEQAQQDFERFWQMVGATGDLPAALQTWDTTYNAAATQRRYYTHPALRYGHKALRILRKLPSFVSNA
ncbi:hypothetical protein XM38_012770 [Halomicronema hongdechloris C2206]|uniref:Sulfotransferase family protein n=1 Tax=Halomicronema hongdechloris C2206 TaxID=1641165 RepID=A0A1Z3HJ47_9CYAN|nr:hypothetical protein [Halomicronema hongdechloris]ASC70339.1 hypothetical protein XM38_012770 [Halomicronema hongdechloris C2206]